MTDIRKCAQAVIDSYELGITTRQVYYGHLLERNIEALRQAIAEPVEPMVVQVNGHVFHRDGKQFIQFEQKSPSLDVPRITLDDNEWFAFQDKINCPIQDKPELAKLLRGDVDALIAEAVAKEREARAQIAMDFWCDAGAEAIRARGVK